MKLGNFLSLDPHYAGKGLQRGGKLNQEVWAEFAHDTAKLNRTAVSIGESANWLAETRAEYSPVSDEDEFPEGQREANPSTSLRTSAITLKERRTLVRSPLMGNALILARRALLSEHDGFSLVLT